MIARAQEAERMDEVSAVTSVDNILRQTAPFADLLFAFPWDRRSRTACTGSIQQL